jgi:hypothetical protein
MVVPIVVVNDLEKGLKHTSVAEFVEAVALLCCDFGARITCPVVIDGGLGIEELQRLLSPARVRCVRISLTEDEMLRAKQWGIPWSDKLIFEGFVP